MTVNAVNEWDLTKEELAKAKARIIRAPKPGTGPIAGTNPRQIIVDAPLPQGGNIPEPS